MLTVGSITQGWNVRRELHQGSMAVTYEVHPEGAHVDGVPVPDGRYVLKIMFLRDPSFQERLRRVGEAQKGLQHPHLVDIIDVLDIQGSVAVVSRYVEGTDLAEWAQEDHEIGEIMVLLRELVDGLVAAHERGLVHRNLKPQKVQITREGTPLIHDFMLGKTLTTDSARALTQMGTTFGTPQYMSPEQFRGAADVDARADLFSLGCLGFEILTGRRAFDGQGLMDIYQQVSSGAAPAPSTLNSAVPPEVDALIADLLAVDRDARPASARVVAERLDKDPVLLALQGQAPLDTPPPPTTTTPPPAADRHPRTAGETIMPPEDMPADDDDDVLGTPEITREGSIPQIPGPGGELSVGVPGVEPVKIAEPEPDREEPEPAVAAADPQRERAPSAPVPPPPFAASNATGTVWLALFLLLVGLLAATVGLLAGGFVL